MTTRHMSLRIDQECFDELEAESKRNRESLSDLARRLIEEGLRMEKHPGIVFRAGPTGRRAGLADGPDVWEVVAAFPVWDDTWDLRSHRTLGSTSVVPYQVKTALHYYADYPQEIDERIRRNREEGERAYAEWREKQQIPA